MHGCTFVSLLVIVLALLLISTVQRGLWSLYAQQIVFSFPLCYSAHTGNATIVYTKQYCTRVRVSPHINMRTECARVGFIHRHNNNQHTHTLNLPAVQKHLTYKIYPPFSFVGGAYSKVFCSLGRGRQSTVNEKQTSIISKFTSFEIFRYQKECTHINI